MSNIVIKVENLTKIYHLYEKPTDRLKESLNPFRKKYHKDFYALNDVSFEVKKGETVGIIGKNGAGKSTLLKIITGVLTPTSGSVEVNGKIASLLELGAGFNPEMTGLENIYLQGTIMGFTREEIDKKIDDILSFADIGEFIYQPVKTYSSGMFARLAFATAINVEPDILIVDEVLSVGDIKFQLKCIRKMEDMRNKGITILFVSHDMQTINKFCNKVIWIEKGKIKKLGEPKDIINEYTAIMSYGEEIVKNNINQKLKEKLEKKKKYNLIDVSNCESFGEKKALITGILFLNENNKVTLTLKQGEWATFICEFYTSVDLYNVAIGILFKDNLNNDILTFNNYMYDCPIEFVSKNTKIRVEITFKVPKIFPKEHVITVALSEGIQENHIQQHWIYEATKINIISIDNKDLCLFSLYKEEIRFRYEKI